MDTMTPEQREVFVAWAENQAHGAVYGDKDTAKTYERHMLGAFDVMRTVFPYEEDWLGEVWDSLMR
jgi:hypothetical protein